MATTLENVKAAITKLINSLKASLADKKITLTEAWTLVQDTLADCVKIAQELGNLTGPQKKELIMGAAMLLYDLLISKVKLPFGLSFIAPLFSGVLRPVFEQLISGTVDSLVNIFWKNEVFTTKGVK